jgi:hypothetical protein
MILRMYQMCSAKLLDITQAPRCTTSLTNKTKLNADKCFPPADTSLCSRHLFTRSSRKYAVCYWLIHQRQHDHHPDVRCLQNLICKKLRSNTYLCTFFCAKISHSQNRKRKWAYDMTVYSESMTGKLRGTTSQNRGKKDKKGENFWGRASRSA